VKAIGQLVLIALAVALIVAILSGRANDPVRPAPKSTTQVRP
jgi:hypothetical protein